MESSREVHLDATLTLILDLNALEQIIGSKLPHPNLFFFSIGIPSLDFESMHPLRFTLVQPTPLILPPCKPFVMHPQTPGKTQMRV
jgi:hypothetical protein